MKQNLSDCIFCRYYQVVKGKQWSISHFSELTSYSCKLIEVHNKAQRTSIELLLTFEIS